MASWVLTDGEVYHHLNDELLQEEEAEPPEAPTKSFIAFPGAPQLMHEPNA